MDESEGVNKRPSGRIEIKGARISSGKAVQEGK